MKQRHGVAADEGTLYDLPRPASSLGRTVNRRLRHLFSGASLLAVSIWPQAVSGQSSPFVLEVRGGGVLPLTSFSGGARPGEGVSAGSTFGVAFALSGSSRRTTTLGFSQHRFPCYEAGCERNGRHVATTFDAGLRINMLRRGTVIPWVRFGALTTLVEIDAFGGREAGISDRGYGGEVGVGLYVGTFAQLAFNPGVRVSAVNVRLPDGQLLRMRYAVVDLGFSLAF